ncbi:MULTISPECIES: ABC transporter permease [Brevibacillus]|jgi:oligopeptide transport system permease protein|uniref:Oligopeptide ABC transporter permease n=1 Tax=Brevibacillus borstelensis AK1 TaxID=1300222 RepID=M8EDY6_9BACL|nr:ABC transporter permease [Brevibacillus borstelensis]EMT53680.1 oligopeptide ABC transporter permease [Brevibacillus borstelensis AK1]KKX56903.1 diguanylate cyclase [Brevibacillus borstelensis cifa_chp40]MBE5397710.1 ABC transporter permease [Brevibacillus borstelensis]MCC0562648.1 ABC transporter permease [Brevibacillus borstelensis]MCM3469744.1 ABC transporter permease [Brevibacillus borstelensis]
MQLTKEHFEPISVDLRQAESIKRPSLSFWADVWRRLKMNKVAMASLVFILILVACAILIPILSSNDYFTTDLAGKNKKPSAEHWFGTDDLGRDVFVRVWYGARISLEVGFAAAFIDLIIGVIWGGLAGFYGGKVDEIMMRIADILYAIPYLLVVILLMVVLEPGVGTIIIALTITGWIGMARIVRGQILQLKAQEFVLAARSLGADNNRLIFKHLIPNALGPIIVTLSLTVPSAIFAESFLSFIGLGVSAPVASWGTMSNEGLSAMKYYPWRLMFPALFISITMLAFNLLGDGLRDAVDPRLRK